MSTTAENTLDEIKAKVKEWVDDRVITEEYLSDRGECIYINSDDDLTLLGDVPLDQVVFRHKKVVDCELSVPDDEGMMTTKYALSSCKSTSWTCMSCHHHISTGIEVFGYLGATCFEEFIENYNEEYGPFTDFIHRRHDIVLGISTPDGYLCLHFDRAYLFDLGLITKDEAQPALEIRERLCEVAPAETPAETPADAPVEEK